MNAKQKIDSAADLTQLKVIKYPDPRLKEICTPIEAVDDSVRALAQRMVELMFETNGVGLAASQVGITVQLFAATPTFSPDDVHVYINPKILSGKGSQTDEEGCLSFPGIYCKVKRFQDVVVEATDLNGEVFQQTCTDLHARIIQHESDHLNGMLLSDKMNSLAKLANRKTLAALEAEFIPRM